MTLEIRFMWEKLILSLQNEFAASKKEEKNIAIYCFITFYFIYRLQRDFSLSFDNSNVNALVKKIPITLSKSNELVKNVCCRCWCGSISFAYEKMHQLFLICYHVCQEFVVRRLFLMDLLSSLDWLEWQVVVLFLFISYHQINADEQRLMKTREFIGT